MFKRIFKILELCIINNLETITKNIERANTRNIEHANLLKVGFLPVTDDFWRDAGMWRAVGKGFDWALLVPVGKTQKYMPFHENILKGKSLKELAEIAERAEKNLLSM